MIMYPRGTKIAAGAVVLVLAGTIGHVIGSPSAAPAAMSAPAATFSAMPASAPSPSRTPGLYTPPAGYQASSPAPQSSSPAGQQQQGSTCGSGRQQQGSSSGPGQQQQSQGQGSWQQQSAQPQQSSPSGRGNGGSALQARRWGGGGNRNGGGRWRGRGSGRGNRQGSSQGNCQQQGNGRQQGPSPAPGQQSYGPQQQPTPGPSSAAPPVAAAPAQSSAPTGACGVQPSWAPSGCLKTTLDDEFNGNTLPPGWSTGWFGTGITGPVNSMECAKYNSANVSVSGGYLHLAMQGGYGAIVTSDPNSGGGFSFTYGDVEWRAYLPALSSNPSEIANWPALWVNGPDGAGRGEYDVVEGLHGSAMSHIPTDGNAGFQDGGGPGWHTFGVSWTQGGTVTFYHDGQQVGQKTGVPNTGPMYLVMGNQCGSSTQQMGTDMLVDWVRVWS